MYFCTKYVHGKWNGLKVINLKVKAVLPFSLTCKLCEIVTITEKYTSRKSYNLKMIKYIKYLQKAKISQTFIMRNGNISKFTL